MIGANNNLDSSLLQTIAQARAGVNTQEQRISMDELSMAKEKLEALVRAGKMDKGEALAIMQYFRGNQAADDATNRVEGAQLRQGAERIGQIDERGSQAQREAQVNDFEKTIVTSLGDADSIRSTRDLLNAQVDNGQLAQDNFDRLNGMLMDQARDLVARGQITAQNQATLWNHFSAGDASDATARFLETSNSQQTTAQLTAADLVKSDSFKIGGSGGIKG